MLKQLGLQNYEKNFKKGLLTDQTLPLLNDRYIYFLFNLFPTVDEKTQVFKKNIDMPKNCPYQ